MSVGHVGTSLHQPTLGPGTTGETLEAVEDRETIFVVNNRIGIERGE